MSAESNSSRPSSRIFNPYEIPSCGAPNRPVCLARAGPSKQNLTLAEQFISDSRQRDEFCPNVKVSKSKSAI
jgi:hypothetical protein